MIVFDTSTIIGAAINPHTPPSAALKMACERDIPALSQALHDMRYFGLYGVVATALIGLAGCEQPSIPQRLVLAPTGETTVSQVVSGNLVEDYYPAGGSSLRPRGKPPVIVTRQARTICAVVGLKMPPDECSAFAILTASRTQTNRQLWFEKLVNTRGSAAPPDCPDPVLAEYEEPSDAPAAKTYLCHPRRKPISSPKKTSGCWQIAWLC